MGESTPSGEPRPVAQLDDGQTDGYRLSRHCWGTYIHGILDNDVVVNDMLADFTTTAETAPFDYRQFKDQQYDRLADVIRAHVDMQQIYDSLTRPN